MKYFAYLMLSAKAAECDWNTIVGALSAAPTTWTAWPIDPGCTNKDASLAANTAACTDNTVAGCYWTAATAGGTCTAGTTGALTAPVAGCLDAGTTPKDMGQWCYALATTGAETTVANKD